MGGWHVEEGDKKEKRFIHPHAGPLPKTEMAESSELEHSESDPIFVIGKHFSSAILKTMSEEILKDIKSEIGES